MRGYPNVRTFGSRFGMMMSARKGKANIIKFNSDDSDAGLYLTRYSNQDFGTPLAARGSVEDLEKLLHELRA